MGNTHESEWHFLGRMDILIEAARTLEDSVNRANTEDARQLLAGAMTQVSLAVQSERSHRYTESTQ
ncbi:MAG: hypothetical protein M3Q36_02765 [bacterium]|nr:hypothetical protein [bacterium]